jgi:hypothetical protein
MVAMLTLLHEISINTKNVEELFAETFAFYMQKTKLPDEYVELMEESLSWAKAAIKNTGD